MLAKVWASLEHMWGFAKLMTDYFYKLATTHPLFTSFYTAVTWGYVSCHIIFSPRLKSALHFTEAQILEFGRDTSVLCVQDGPMLLSILLHNVLMMLSLLLTVLWCCRWSPSTWRTSAATRSTSPSWASPAPASPPRKCKIREELQTCQWYLIRLFWLLAPSYLRSHKTYLGWLGINFFGKKFTVSKYFGCKFFLIASLICKSHVDISTHLQEGVNQTIQYSERGYYYLLQKERL